MTALADIPFTPQDNLIVLSVRIGRSASLSFLLDTGASASVIDAACAARLGLKPRGGAAGSATTEGGQIAMSPVSGVTLDLPGLSLPVPTLVCIDLKGLKAGLGRNIDGILGYDFFRRYVVEIDYDARRVRVYEPATFRDTGFGEPFSLRLKDNTPCIEARIWQAGGHSASGQFEFDTGFTGTLNLYPYFVVVHTLAPRADRAISIRSGAILAGKSRLRIARIEELRLGDIAIHHPVVQFSQDTEGDAANTGSDGLIGGELLRRFRVTIDYSRSRVLLKPGRAIQEAYEFDGSGLSLAAEGPAFTAIRVRALVMESPAAQAGLAVGDYVLEIDDTPVTRIPLPEIRRQFRKIGHSFRLKIDRGGNTRIVVFKTRRLI